MNNSSSITEVPDDKEDPSKSEPEILSGQEQSESDQRNETSPQNDISSTPQAPAVQQVLVPDSEPPPVVEAEGGEAENRPQPRLSDSDDGFKEVECGICFQVRVGPHFLCQNDHSLCRYCFIRIKKSGQGSICPFGRCAYDVPARRNTELEMAIQYLKRQKKLSKCEWRKCQILLNSGRQLDEHMTACVHHPFRNTGVCELIISACLAFTCLPGAGILALAFLAKALIYHR